MFPYPVFFITRTPGIWQLPIFSLSIFSGLELRPLRNLPLSGVKGICRWTYHWCLTLLDWLHTGLQRLRPLLARRTRTQIMHVLVGLGFRFRAKSKHLSGKAI